MVGPIKVAPLGTIGTSNPDDGSPLRVGDYLPDIAVDMNSGAAYIVWSDAQGGTVNHVVLSARPTAAGSGAAQRRSATRVLSRSTTP